MSRYFRGLLLVSCLWASLPIFADDTYSVTVLPFTSLKGEQQAWLGKGIADLLMSKLIEVDSFSVLERDQLQTFLKEAELSQSAFFNQEQVTRVGNIAKVDYVVSGNYVIDDDVLEITLIFLELSSQNIIQREQINGEFKELNKLITRLSLQFIRNRNIPLDSTALEKLKFTPTDSISATEHFYRALDQYDSGVYTNAFSEFYAAFKQDPKYWQAQFWMGKMLEYQGFDELAINTYQSLYKNASAKTVGHDALYFAASLLEKHDQDASIKAYETLVNNKPTSPHSLEAAFQLGKLLEENGDISAAYSSFAFIVNFQSNDAFTKNNRQSRFFNWSESIGRYKEAIVLMTLLYPKLMDSDSNTELPEQPRGIFLLDPENPVISEKHFGDTHSMFHQEATNSGWNEKFYTLIVPHGYIATGADLEIKGHIFKKNTNIDYTMRVLPFPLPRNYQNSWLGVIYGQTLKPTTLNKYVPFYGNNQKIFTIQLIENRGEIHHWKISVHLEPDEASEKKVSTQVTHSNKFLEGKLLSSIEFNEQAFSGIAKPLAAHWYDARQTLALENNHNDGLFLVSVRGELGGEQTDLWLNRSADGTQWSEPELMSVNSTSEDFSPRLIRGEDGLVRLFWISNRKGFGWEIWNSTFLSNEKQWSMPDRVPLEKFSESSPAKLFSASAIDLLHYAVCQDSRGRWIIAYRSSKERKLIVLSSIDTKEWKLESKSRAILKHYNLSLIEDKSGKYRLASIASDKKLHLWSSNDLKEWSKKSYKVNRYSYIDSAIVHPIELYAEDSNTLLLLMSDVIFGLEYVRFNPDVEIPDLDLVKDIGLEAYASTEWKDGQYLIAHRKNDKVNFRQYTNFQEDIANKKRVISVIYNEYSEDYKNNHWRRIYARSRVILPDVTTVGIEKDGRVWWGIETGVMSLKGNKFYAENVHDGFFSHHVSNITPCNGITFFISKDLQKPVLGYVTWSSISLQPS